METLDLKQAAAFLKMHPVTVQVKARAGEIPAATPIHSPSVATVTSVNVTTETDGKPITLLDRQREARRQKVIAMLEAAPGTQRAIYTDTDSDPHNVILTVAVRPCQQTCEMLIPKAKYDPWKLLELVERHGQATH